MQCDLRFSFADNSCTDESSDQLLFFPPKSLLHFHPCVRLLGPFRGFLGELEVHERSYLPRSCLIQRRLWVLLKSLLSMRSMLAGSTLWRRWHQLRFRCGIYMTFQLTAQRLRLTLRMMEVDFTHLRHAITRSRARASKAPFQT